MHVALFALLALPVLPALAQPTLDKRATFECDHHNNIPDFDGCGDLIWALSQKGGDVKRADVARCANGCCISWSRRCPGRLSDLVWHAEVIHRRCGSGASGRIWGVDPCFGTVCLSNRDKGCSDM